MIRYTKLIRLLREKGMRKSDLRKRGINPTQLNKLLNEGRTIGIENKLCEILRCQPGEFMEYISDEVLEHEQQLSDDSE